MIPHVAGEVALVPCHGGHAITACLTTLPTVLGHLGHGVKDSFVALGLPVLQEVRWTRIKIRPLTNMKVPWRTQVTQPYKNMWEQRTDSDSFRSEVVSFPVAMVQIIWWHFHAVKMIWWAWAGVWWQMDHWNSYSGWAYLAQKSSLQLRLPVSHSLQICRINTSFWLCTVFVHDGYHIIPMYVYADVYTRGCVREKQHHFFVSSLNPSQNLEF